MAISDNSNLNSNLWKIWSPTVTEKVLQNTVLTNGFDWKDWQTPTTTTSYAGHIYYGFNIRSAELRKQEKYKKLGKLKEYMALKALRK